MLCLKFRMIYFFISLNVILKCCEAVVHLSNIHQVTITKVNVDALEVIEKGFDGIDNELHKVACKLLRFRRWYIFKPLPIDREILVILLSTIHEINSSRDFSSSSQYNLNLWQCPSTSSQQGSLNSLPLQDLPSSSGSAGATRKRKNTMVENIYVGTARKKENDNSPLKPLGFTAKYLGLKQINTTSVETDHEFIQSCENEPNKKENRLIYPESDDINQMEENRLKNFTVCLGLFYHRRSCHVNALGFESDVQTINEEEIDEEKMRDEIAELSCIKSKFYDIICCNILKSDQKIYSFSIIEHPTDDKIYVWEGSPSQVVRFDVYRYFFPN